MRRTLLRSALLLLVVTAAAHPQSTSGPDSTSRVLSARPAHDSLFRRARRLVGDGNGLAGRALVDSLLKSADPRSPAYGDALYWHGVVALTAAEAERDYRRVIVEYPLAYYKDDALLSLAELEQARGERAGALQHLQRYVKEHGPGKERGIAALGAARLAFDQRDTKLGCAMLAESRASITAAEVELRNQIDAFNSRCGQEVASVPTPAAAPAKMAPPAPPVTAPVPSPVTNAQPKARDTARTPTRDSAHALAAVTPSPAAPKAATALKSAHAPAESASHAAGRFTVQLAAYETRPPAEQLVAKLATRGVRARVSGTSKPFRVRLGFFRTRQEATNEVAALRKRGMIGFVAEEVPEERTSP